MGRYLAVGISGFLVISLCIVMACVTGNRDDKIEIMESRLSGMPCDMYVEPELKVISHKTLKVKSTDLYRKREVIERIPETEPEIQTEPVIETTNAVIETQIEVIETTVGVIETPTTVVETPSPVIETPITVTEIPTEPVVETQPSDGFVMQAVNGAVLEEALQRYLYNTLCERGIGWYFDIALCQLYQESRFNPGIVGKNGLDSGIAQICSPYWGRLCVEAMLPNGNIFDPYDNIFVYTFLMQRYLNAHGGDVNWGLSAYFTGDTAYSPEYIQQVMQWIGTVTIY